MYHFLTFFYPDCIIFWNCKLALFYDSGQRPACPFQTFLDIWIICDFWHSDPKFWIQKPQKTTTQSTKTTENHNLQICKIYTFPRSTSTELNKRKEPPVWAARFEGKQKNVCHRKTKRVSFCRYLHEMAAGKFKLEVNYQKKWNRKPYQGRFQQARPPSPDCPWNQLSDEEGAAPAGRPSQRSVFHPEAPFDPGSILPPWKTFVKQILNQFPEYFLPGGGGPLNPVGGAFFTRGRWPRILWTEL